MHQHHDQHHPTGLSEFHRPQSRKQAAYQQARLGAAQTGLMACELAGSELETGKQTKWKKKSCITIMKIEFYDVSSYVSHVLPCTTVGHEHKRDIRHA